MRDRYEDNVSTPCRRDFIGITTLKIVFNQKFTSSFIIIASSLVSSSLMTHIQAERCEGSNACFVAHSSNPTDKNVITQTVQWVTTNSSSTRSILLEFHAHLDGNAKGSIVHFVLMKVHWALSGHVRLTSFPQFSLVTLLQKYYNFNYLNERQYRRSGYSSECSTALQSCR